MSVGETVLQNFEVIGRVCERMFQILEPKFDVSGRESISGRLTHSIQWSGGISTKTQELKHFVQPSLTLRNTIGQTL